MKKELLMYTEQSFKNSFEKLHLNFKLEFYPICDGEYECNHIADAFCIKKDNEIIFEEWYQGWGNFKEHNSCKDLKEEIEKILINDKTDNGEK